MTKGKATWSAILRGVARGAYLATTANPSSLRTRATQIQRTSPTSEAWTSVGTVMSMTETDDGEGRT